jgi:hypothetical protein
MRLALALVACSLLVPACVSGKAAGNGTKSAPMDAMVKSGGMLIKASDAAPVAVTGAPAPKAPPAQAAPAPQPAAVGPCAQAGGVLQGGTSYCLGN